ncbi:MAG TPA: glyceraldehyde-3-phosphate dehydrogenase, partial [Burkholderiales bacterium]|nr:glyceraldehyde-3-phosphate dehydrogenase [Burkholderiales bacterium]
DPEDGAFDASEWLLERKGFLPVPILITEPAVGYGAGLGLLFFRESIGEMAKRGRRGSQVTPPDIYGVAAAGTDNGTRFGGAGALVTFLDDTWRYKGAVGRASVNLDFYGLGGGNLKLGYNLDGWLSSQKLSRRLGDGDNWIAARWVYLDLTSSFDSLQDPAVLPPHSTVRRSSGAGLSLEHDSRDNIFTPSRGWLGALEGLFYSPDIGSDETFQIYRAYGYAYLPYERFVLGLRADDRAGRGDVPFYQLPYIDLRGVPAVRYQGENAGVVEVELRWNVTPRWALIGFGGAGRTWGERTDFANAQTITTVGAGFRYLVARRLGLYAGVDIAWGPEDTAFYIQVGSAWR